ncbi:MAG TPA: type II secretion system F family protein [Candidatus Methylomirabilis sp.]|nr:type II secretion system F family protein [Candidatus Methylomirabilis sp.]
MPTTSSEKNKTSAESTVTKIARKEGAAEWKKFLAIFQTVPIKEKLIFIQNLSVMIKAGIPVLAAFRTLAEQSESKFFSRVLKQISAKIEQGSSLSDSLKQFPSVFNDLFVNMVNSGEVSGKLEEVLHYLYIQTKKQYELTARIKGALTYPIVVVVAILGIGFFMMAFVIPKLTAVFLEYDVQLPLATRILIFVSNFLANNWLVAIIGTVVIVLVLMRIFSTNQGKYLLQAVTLRLPIFGPIIKKVNLARFARTSSSLLKTDIMIVNAFRITAETLGNLHFRKAVLEISEKIKTGGQINEVIKNYPHFFPPMVTQMVTVGEQTGEVSNILSDLADFYEGEIDQTMQNLPSIIEPVLILILGLGVGAIAIAVIMPMYSLSSAV